MDFETTVKLNIYATIASTAQVPSAPEVARALGVSLDEVQAAFQALYLKRLLVPEPGDPSRIRMAPPFSGIKTPFQVSIQDKMYYANCAWDAFGIPAALHADARVHTWDAHSGEPITLEVRDGQPVPQPCVIHFAVPAARWWEDILYT
jgi:DNA-binding transcriptional MocR family regulator